MNIEKLIGPFVDITPKSNIVKKAEKNILKETKQKTNFLLPDNKMDLQTYTKNLEESLKKNPNDLELRIQLAYTRNLCK